MLSIFVCVWKKSERFIDQMTSHQLTLAWIGFSLWPISVTLLDVVQYQWTEWSLIFFRMADPKFSKEERHFRKKSKTWTAGGMGTIARTECRKLKREWTCDASTSSPSASSSSPSRCRKKTLFRWLCLTKIILSWPFMSFLHCCFYFSEGRDLQTCVKLVCWMKR